MTCNRDHPKSNHRRPSNRRRRTIRQQVRLGRGCLTHEPIDVYTYGMKTETPEKVTVPALFELPCACQNLRRATRVATRIYDQELAKAGIEITQFGLLTALGLMGETNQKGLSAGFAMDSTTLTRTLGLMAEARLDSRQAWKGQARTPVQPDGSRKAATRAGPTLLGVRRTKTAWKTRRCGLERYEGSGIAGDRSRDGGMIFLVTR